jgi:hypothetical protein
MAKAAKAAPKKAVPKKAAKKYELKTHATDVSVKAFIAAVEKDGRREDAETLLTLFGKATGWKAKMWGPTIIGFGRYKYTYDSGHTGEMCVVGFSPRKAALSLYACYPDEAPDLIKKLGKAKTSKACIYVNKLADIDLGVLEKLIKVGVANTEKKWPVTAE